MLIKSWNQNIFPIFKMNPTRHLIHPIIYSLLRSACRSSKIKIIGGGRGGGRTTSISSVLQKYVTASVTFYKVSMINTIDSSDKLVEVVDHVRD